MEYLNDKEYKEIIEKVLEFQRMTSGFQNTLVP